MTLDLLQQLITTPSHSGNESRYAILLAKWCKKNLPEFKQTKVPVSKGRYNLLVLPKNPKLIFACHMDTVPPTPKSQPKIKKSGDKIYGLGTKDMKGGTAAALLAMSSLPKDIRKKAGFLFYCDEEYAQKGMEMMVAKSALIPKSTRYLLTPESRFNLSYASRGLAVLEVSVEGKRAHSARPHQGINAIEKLYEFYLELSKLLSPSTATITSIKSEGPTNVVPDQASAIISIRIADADLTEKKLLSLAKNIATNNGIKATFIIKTYRQASIPKNKDHVYYFLSVADTKIELADHMLAGYNDIAMLSTKLKIPFLGFGPYGENNHGPNEWVSLKSIEQCIGVYTRLIEKL